MKVGFGVLLVCGFLFCSEYIHATVLPDACGKGNVNFSVTTQPGAAAPDNPKTNEAQIVFIETIEKEGMGLCIGCGVTTRFGVDGSWVGANNGGTYFVYDVPAGEHHLCANWQSRLSMFNKNVGVAEVNAEPGKVYYFEAKVVMKSFDAGNGMTDQTYRLYLKQLSEDEGKYAVKISALSRSKPKK